MVQLPKQLHFLILFIQGTNERGKVVVSKVEKTKILLCHCDLKINVGMYKIGYRLSANAALFSFDHINFRLLRLKTGLRPTVGVIKHIRYFLTAREKDCNETLPSCTVVT